MQTFYKILIKMSSLKLTSFTPINSETKKKIITIWKTIHDSNDSLQFRNPVDWKGMGLLDYPKYIQKAMDLNTISRKLREQKYRTVENVLDDIQLIFDNCKVYNAPGSWIYNLADKLEKSFIKMIRNFIPKIIESNPKSKINPDYLKSKQPQIIQQPKDQQPPFFIEEVCYNDKIKFTDKLSHISSENLQTIFKKIIDKNPEAVKFLPLEEEQKSQKPEQKVEELKSQQVQPQNSLNLLNFNQIAQNQLMQKISQTQQIQNPQKVEAPQMTENFGKPLDLQSIDQQKPANSEKIVQPVQITQNKMQIEQSLPKQRGRRSRSAKNQKNQIKQTPVNAEQKFSISKMEIGSKAQIFVDDLNIETFQELMKMLEVMVEQKDKVMKKIKLD